MEASATAAGWLSFIATAVGLGSLITQASGIQEQMDPYHAYRTAAHLGVWVKRQPKKALLQFQKPTPVGPVIYAQLTDGFCGTNSIYISRLPLEKPGDATWTALLAIYHEAPPTLTSSETKSPITNTNSWVLEKAATDPLSAPASASHLEAGFNAPSPVPRKQLEWTSLQTRPLVRHDTKASIPVGRETLICILLICNSRAVFRYSDASGHRAAYASYIGHFYIDWPIGRPAEVSFSPHVLHSLYTAVYPLTMRVRVDKCIEMAAGVVMSVDKAFQVAFCGRKGEGSWRLECQRNGFPGAHGSRHLFNLMGGNSYSVDFLRARPTDEKSGEDEVVLELPSTERGKVASMVVPKFEQGVLQYALDCLPWTTLPWSIHRGLKDILVAYAKPTMDKYRGTFASQLRRCVDARAHKLEAQGWGKEFVRAHMAEMAASSFLAGSGSAGDGVRVVTDIALLMAGRSIERVDELDELHFWRRESHEFGEEEGKEERNGQARLRADAIIGLTKAFVLEWSNDFDYQMYHDLPPGLLWH